MKISGVHPIQVSQAGHRVLLSKARFIRQTFERQTQEQPNPMIGLGFYAYAIQGDDPIVVISEGAVRVTVTADGGGNFANLDSGSSEVMSAQFFSGFTPDTSGYLVFRYAQGTDISPPSTSATAEDVDFGQEDAPGFDFPDIFFDLTLAGGIKTTGAESNTIEDSQGNFQRYAIVFMEEPPVAEAGVFSRIICRITVNPAGVVTLAQVHFGDIHVPLGYIARMSGFDVVSHE